MTDQFTIQEFANMMAEELGTPKGHTYDAAKAAFAALAERVNTGGRASIHGLGSFSQVTRKARKGRNPKTGEAIDIPARTVVIFKCSSALKAVVTKAKKKK